MARTKAYPVRGFIDLMTEMERIRNLGRTGLDSGQPAAARTQATAWVPTADVFARGEDLVIVAEIAGVPAADIDIAVSNGVLTISGERRGETDDADVTPYLRERYYGAFRRSLALPEGVDERTISASFRDGLVTITVPGAAEAPSSAPHHIPVREV